ncbi:MAG: hypothetical protein Q7R76_03795 [Candidatus Woesearchaeota archaeon]|nr:hypothetical protein [Candidatus Woesearchaeota archaeon]
MMLSFKTSVWRGVKKGFSNYGHLLSLPVTILLLVLVYFIGFGITALVARIVGKHFLVQRFPPDTKSFWSDLNLKTQKREQYYRQF